MAETPPHLPPRRQTDPGPRPQRSTNFALNNTSASFADGEDEADDPVYEFDGNQDGLHDGQLDAAIYEMAHPGSVHPDVHADEDGELGGAVKTSRQQHGLARGEEGSSPLPNSPTERDIAAAFPVERGCVVLDESGNTIGRGTIRFAGRVAGDGWDVGLRIGVELESDLGENNGRLLGKEFFSCQVGRGVFPKPQHVRLEGNSVGYATARPVINTPATSVAGYTVGDKVDAHASVQVQDGLVRPDMYLQVNGVDPYSKRSETNTAEGVPPLPPRPVAQGVPASGLAGLPRWLHGTMDKKECERVLTSACGGSVEHGAYFVRELPAGSLGYMLCVGFRGRVTHHHVVARAEDGVYTISKKVYGVPQKSLVGTIEQLTKPLAAWPVRLARPIPVALSAKSLPNGKGQQIFPDAQKALPQQESPPTGPPAWLHGPMSREAADAVLADANGGKIEHGAFLVRERPSFPGEYVLCVGFKRAGPAQATHHIVAPRDSDGVFTISKRVVGTPQTTLVGTIEQLTAPVKGWPVVLSKAVSAPTRQQPDELPTPMALTVSQPQTYSRETHSSEQRNALLSQLVDTETSYVDILETVMSVYASKLADTGVPMERLAYVFERIDEIIAVHRRLLSGFEQQMTRTTGRNLSVPFLAVAERLKVYGKLCFAIPSAVEELDVNQKKQKMVKTLECARIDSGHILGLKDLLNEPLKRVLKYELLLKELIRHTPETHPDRAGLTSAVILAEDLAKSINQSSEALHVVMNIEKSLKKYRGKPLIEYAPLMKDGELGVKKADSKGKLKNTHVFLFERAVVLSRSLKTSFEFQDIIVLTPETRIAKFPTWKLTKEQASMYTCAWLLENGGSDFVFGARTHADKGNWLEFLTAAIRTVSQPPLSDDYDVVEPTSPTMPRRAIEDEGLYEDYVDTRRGRSSDVSSETPLVQEEYQVVDASPMTQPRIIEEVYTVGSDVNEQYGPTTTAMYDSRQKGAFEEVTFDESAEYEYEVVQDYQGEVLEAQPVVDDEDDDVYNEIKPIRSAEQEDPYAVLSEDRKLYARSDSHYADLSDTRQVYASLDTDDEDDYSQIVKDYNALQNMDDELTDYEDETPTEVRKT